MPELIPVENDPFNPSVNLVPVEHDPFALQGDVGAAIQQQNAVEAQRRATAGGLLGHFMTPGRVAQGVQPETPGVMTEADAYRLNQLEDQAQNWAPQQAMNMIGTGVPMAQSGALGSGGGGIKAFHGSPTAAEQLSGNEGLSYLLKPKSQVDVIGKEIGPVKPNGISELKVADAPEGYDASRLVYTKDGQIVGALQVTNASSTGRQVANTYVHPDYRRQGIATALNDFAEQKYGPLARSEGPSEVGEAFRQSLHPPSPSIRAFHGSPYDFEKFDLGKIGTGEGAQSYGHGLYFAENPATAQQYRENLAVTPKVNSFNWNPDGTPNRVGQVASELDAKIGEDDIRQGLKIKDPHATEVQIDDWIKQGRSLYKDAQKSGKTYEVNINADPEHFLDWDKPLSEQSPKVQEAIKKAGLAPTEPDLGSFAGNPVSGVPRWADTPEQMQQLREAGIPGIKYLDQGSRAAATGLRTPTEVPGIGWRVYHTGGFNDFPTQEAAKKFYDDTAKSGSFPKPTSNYVVFNDKLIDIIKKYGLAGLVAGGASHFTTTPVEHNPFAAQQ